jgi:hypothetical protein
MGSDSSIFVFFSIDKFSNVYWKFWVFLLCIVNHLNELYRILQELSIF